MSNRPPTSKSVKRQRQRERRQGSRAAQLEAVRKARQRRTLITAGALGAVVVAAGVLLGVVNSGDGEKVSTTGKEGSTSSSTTPTTVNAAALAAVTCDDRKPENAAPKKQDYKEPPMTIDKAKKYTATMDTSCGKIVLELDAAGAPISVNSFVFLAKEKYYDGLSFHRVVKDFVIQGGDPKGDGTGGPGYTIAEEPPKDGYPVGSLAMAKTSAPHSTGSQFFVVTGPRGPEILGANPTYSRFGKVTQGLEVAQKIETFLPPGEEDAKPSRDLYIFKVEITESAA
jgi:cyclophilin family peptidyl-prolyl cis-trans isomerase